MSGIRNRLHAIYIVLYCQLDLPHYRQRRIEYPTVPSVRKHSFSVIVDLQTNITVHVVLLVEQRLHHDLQIQNRNRYLFIYEVEENAFKNHQLSYEIFRFFLLAALAAIHCNTFNLFTKAHDVARRVVHNLYCISKSRIH